MLFPVIDIRSIEDFEKCLTDKSFEERQFFSKLKTEMEKADSFFQQKIVDAQNKFSILINQVEYLSQNSESGFPVVRIVNL